mgnify:CR=1 FL=1
MPKTKPKIWKEWRKASDITYILSIPYLSQIMCGNGSIWYVSGTKIIFKTKEAAMLKAQSLILKEFRKIQQVMRDKI